jgi:DNA-binding HxlR family transcriptional regulator
MTYKTAVSESINTCAISKAAKLVGDIWTLLIIKELLNSNKRFCELQDSLFQPNKETKISSKTLTQRLKLLESENIINRRVFSGIPVRVEYSLTQKGKDLSGTIKALYDFGTKYM